MRLQNGFYWASSGQARPYIDCCCLSVYSNCLPTERYSCPFDSSSYSTYNLLDFVVVVVVAAAVFVEQGELEGY